MAATKRRFQLLHGSHYDENGVLYKAKPEPGSGVGNVIESEHDLVAKFANKFILLPGEVAPSVHPQLPPQVLPPTPTLAPVAPQAALSGIQQEVKGDDTSSIGKPSAPEFPLGEDVTPIYPAARDNDLKVFRAGGKHWITDSSDLERALHTEGLKTKQVPEVIAELIEKRKKPAAE